MINDICKQYYTNYKETIKCGQGYLNSDCDKTPNFFDTYESLVKFNQSIHFCETLEQTFDYIKQSFDSENKEFFLISILQKSISLDSNSISSTIYPLLNLGEDYFVDIKILGRFSDDEISFFNSYILTSLEHQFSLYAEEYSSVGLYEKAISKLVTPFALLTQNGEVIIHSSSFSNLELLPKECLELKTEDKIELQGQLYTLYSRDIDFNGENYTCFVFIKVKDSLGDTNGKNNFKEISSRELGIISSSIAHELNNPIAGILAGVELINLDESIEESESSSKLVLDIKNSANRIKELIRIFLGFSRASLENELKVSPYESFLHARDLMRFRMVESNTCLDIKKIKTLETFENGMYLPIAAMTFYLVMNEILTKFSHHKLVVGEDGLNFEQDCSFIEYTNRIEIHFFNEIDLSDVLFDQKLIEYLNKLSDLKMDTYPGKVIFSLIEDL